MTATEILAEAAIALGHDVKKTEVAGMAQRGGVVSSHLRFGPKVLSPQIARARRMCCSPSRGGGGMRWPHDAARRAGADQHRRLAPPVVELGLRYPADPIGEMRTSGARVYAFDASAIANGLGNIRLGNTVMLGAIADHPPFSAEVLERCVLQALREKGEQVIEMNRQAFAAGRAAAAEAAKAQGWQKRFRLIAD